MSLCELEDIFFSEEIRKQYPSEHKPGGTKFGKKGEFIMKVLGHFKYVKCCELGLGYRLQPKAGMLWGD